MALTTAGDMMVFMHAFMGIALVIFATLKLFNPTKFAEGFAKYDIIASKSHGYGVVYPFLELGLGLAWLAHWNPHWTYTLTIALFAIGLVGVQSALRRGLNVNCACMGTALNVPLSTVTLAEDIFMIGMSAYMLTTL
ncbi:MAG TPA: MauE/DoxX family redox-associated membrane protein [Alphaproteobacteria bacterium]